jgi:hypothetical protein
METESTTQAASDDGKPSRAAGAPKGNGNAQRHGLNPLKKALYTLGNRALDKRTVAGRALVEWREDLIHDLSGDVSTQQDAIISLAIKTKLLLDSIDVWLLQQPTLIKKRKKSIIHAVQQRQVLADALARYMSMLGLQRKSKLASLSDILPRDDEPLANGNWDSLQPQAVSRGDSQSCFYLRRERLAAL